MADFEATRREFLGYGALAAAAVAGATVTAAADADERPHRRIFKAVKGGKAKDESPIQFFERLKALGFDGVEDGEPELSLEYRDAHQKTGVMIHGLVNSTHWKVRMSDPGPLVRDQARRNLEAALRDAWTLGGSSVLLVPGKVDGDRETHQHVWDRSIEQIEKVLPLAAQLGIRILIETVWNGFCLDPEQFRDYIDSFASPSVGAYFDIGNMQKFAPAHEWIRILGSRTVKLDVKDWGAKNGFCRLGEGDVDWDKVRDELDAIGFTGWATREGRDNDLKDTSTLIDQLLLGVS